MSKDIQSDHKTPHSGLVESSECKLNQVSPHCEGGDDDIEMAANTNGKLVVMDIQKVHPEPTPSTPPDDDAKKGQTDKGNQEDAEEDDGIEANVVKPNVYYKPSVHGKAGWWDTIFFSWGFQFIKRAKTEQLSIDDFGGLEEGMHVKRTYSRLKYTYES